MRGTEHSAKGADAPRRLRRAGLRPTRQRVALAAILFGSGDRHVTAELLHEEAVLAGERVSLATVYNTLHQFKRAGLLREIAIGGQRAYFDTNTSNHNHFFVEAEGLAEIRNARTTYETTDLRARLARHHADVDAAFRGWNEAWLDPQFARAFDITDALAYIRVPILLIQGEADRYGTLAHVRAAEEECYCPVETLVMPGVGHAPHREKPEETLAAVLAFADRLLQANSEAFVYTA